MSARSAEGSSDKPSADLGPFVPRLIPEWLAEAPEARHRQIEGTLVFTDLSGFTAMSERLATLGKVGAEELTGHIDAIFSELITVSGRAGGSMLKFGGDALLTLFWGDGHEGRAAWAALEMQATLGRIGRVETSAGISQLEMTVGAHTGSFDLFLVGDVLYAHRDLFVCGDDAALAVTVESSASSGEVRVSQALAARLDPAATRQDDGRFPLLLTAAEPHLGIPPPPTWPEGTSAAQHVPALLRDHLATGIELAEHRQMAVGFLHLSNIDELIVDIGPDATAQHLHDLVVVAQTAFDGDGVAFISTDISEGGPKIICSTGAVRTYGNDEERLLRALRAVLDHPSPIDVRVGANRGHGFCGYVGPAFRRTFAVMGDVVNTAARVMGKAGPGQLLATPAIVEASETLFASEEIEPFAAKGKSEPLRAFRLGAITGTRERTRHEVAFQGRSDELATLRSELAGAHAGRSRVVEVVGEPGIGKSRLIDELLEGTEGVGVLRERCGRYAAGTPYFPFRTLLGPTFGDRTTAELAEELGDLAPYAGLLRITLGSTPDVNEAIDRLPNDEKREKTHEVVVAAIEAFVTEPTVWVVDDAHWADSSSLELLGHIASTSLRAPLLVCVARHPDGKPVGGTTVELEPLEVAEARAIVEAASPLHLLTQEAEALAERAHGNPLFLIELASSGIRDADELPDSLEAALAARIDALDAAERRILRQLAVLGARFDADLAPGVVDDLPDPGDPVWDRLRAFVDTSGPEWRFERSLVRETAYEGLSFRERRSVHQRAGEAIERRSTDPMSVSQLLSLHFHSAGEHERTLRYSTDAAQKAMDAFAWAEAAIFHSRCADAARALDDAVSLGEALTALAHLELDLSRYDLAQEHYGESLEIKRELGNAQGVAAQLNGLGLVARQLGDYDRARECFEEAMAVLDDLPDAKEKSLALQNLGTVAWLQGRYADAKERFEQSLTEVRRLGDPRATARSLDTLGSVSFALGELEAAREHYTEAGRIGAEIDDRPLIANSFNNLGNVAFQSGAYDEAKANYERCLEIRRELRDRHGIGTILNNLGTIAYFQDRFDEAADHWRGALRIAREISDPRGAAQTLHNLSEIEADGMEAMILCQEALTIRRSLGDLRGVAESLTTLGKLAGKRGNHATARGRYIEAIAVLDELGNTAGLAECLELVAATAAAEGDPAHAATLLGAVDAICDQMDGARSWASDVRASVEADVRAALGDEVYDAAIEVGRSMTLARAITFARESLQTVDA